MRNIFKNLSYITAGFASALLIIMLLLFVLGIRPFILMTSSMEPLYHQGSLCLVDTTVGLGDLTVGDTIVYRSSANSLVLHRLVELSSTLSSSNQEKRDDVEKMNKEIINVVMQGDANSSYQDIELSHINYIGREILSIPELGNFFMSFQRFVWWIIGALVIFSCMPRVVHTPHDQEINKKAGCVG